MQKEDQEHVCPVRALAEWIEVSSINKGYLFRRIWSGDRVADLDKNTPMVSLNEVFLPVITYMTAADIRAIPGTVSE